MGNAVRIFDSLVKEVKLFSKVDNRPVTRQIKPRARTGKCAEQNPDLTYGLIKEILIGLEDLEHGESSEYRFG